jgi:hypothetical protein
VLYNNDDRRDVVSRQLLIICRNLAEILRILTTVTLVRAAGDLVFQCSRLHSDLCLTDYYPPWYQVPSLIKLSPAALVSSRLNADIIRVPGKGHHMRLLTFTGTAPHGDSSQEIGAGT